MSAPCSNPPAVKTPIDPCLDLVRRWRAAVALFEVSATGDEEAAAMTYGAVLPEFEQAPAAQSLEGAIAALELAHEEDGMVDRITGAMIMSALTFLKTLVTPVSRPATLAELLAYREWLHVEGNVLAHELIPHLGDAAFIPCNTGADHMHLPAKVSWRDVEQPSDRAVRVMTAAGVDLDIVRRTSVHTGAAAPALESAAQ